MHPFEGINAFVYYAPTFFAALGQKGDMPLILSGMVNICQLIAGIPTSLFLDQVGRRKLAIGGGFAMAVPHLIMAGVVGKFNSSWDEHPAMGWLGVALICEKPRPFLVAIMNQWRNTDSHRSQISTSSATRHRTAPWRGPCPQRFSRTRSAPRVLELRPP